jgi:AcrR family transcriptional regulator
MSARSERKRVTKAPEERRQDILDAAVRVFAEKGIPRTTVSDIAGAAGVAKGTFYLYFNSKEELLGALKERFVDEILEHTASFAERVGREDWWALVDAAIESFVDFMGDHRSIIQIMVQEGITPETSPQFAECERKVDEVFAAGIRAGVEAGAFRTGDPELTARFLHHALDGALTRAILYEDRFDRQRLVAGAQEMARKALAP